MSGCDTLQEKCIIRILEFPAVQLLWLHAIGLSHYTATLSKQACYHGMREA